MLSSKLQVGDKIVYCGYRGVVKQKLDGEAILFEHPKQTIILTPYQINHFVRRMEESRCNQ